MIITSQCYQIILPLIFKDSNHKIYLHSQSFLQILAKLYYRSWFLPLDHPGSSNDLRWSNLPQIECSWRKSNSSESKSWNCHRHNFPCQLWVHSWSENPQFYYFILLGLLSWLADKLHFILSYKAGFYKQNTPQSPPSHLQDYSKCNNAR